jgi:hypothetical protein
MFLVHTLSPEYWHTLATRCCIALSMLTSVMGFFMIAFGCDIEAPWSQIVNECESIVSRMSPDAPIVCIPLNQIPTVQALDRDNRLRHCVGTGNLRHHLTHALQRAKAMDRQVQSHHGLCAPTTVYIIVLQVALHQTYMSISRIIIIAVYRLLSLRDLRSSSDPFFDRVLPIAWTQGEQAYGFATVVIPSLMPFLMKLNTGLGALSREDFVMETTRHESSGNFALQSLKPSQRGSMVSQESLTTLGKILLTIIRTRCERTMLPSNLRWLQRETKEGACRAMTVKGSW